MDTCWLVSLFPIIKSAVTPPANGYVPVQKICLLHFPPTSTGQQLPLMNMDRHILVAQLQMPFRPCPNMQHSEILLTPGKILGVLMMLLSLSIWIHWYMQSLMVLP